MILTAKSRISEEIFGEVRIRAYVVVKLKVSESPISVVMLVRKITCCSK